MDVPALDIDDQLADEEKGTSISGDLEDGIIPIYIPSGGQDVLVLLP